MQGALATKFEHGISRAACASFALACAYAAYERLPGSLSLPVLGACAAAAGAIAFLLCGRLLSAIDGERRSLPTPQFDLFEYAPEPLEELLLTNRYEPPASEPLILDDILAELEPDSRVVRLFDRQAMPTPAQLKSQIDAHLGRGTANAPAVDASQALHDALAELRRSML